MLGKHKIWDTKSKKWLNFDGLNDKYALSTEGKVLRFHSNGKDMFSEVVEHLTPVFALPQPDKEGNTIYIGDKLYADGNIEGEDFIGVVAFDETSGSCIVKTVTGRTIKWIPHTEVVARGSIYDDEMELITPIFTYHANEPKKIVAKMQEALETASFTDKTLLNVDFVEVETKTAVGILEKSTTGKLSGIPYTICKNCGKETIKSVHFHICTHCKKNYNHQ